MKYNFKKKISILFTPWESRWHPIFSACPAIADTATADCQGLAVAYYSFALGRLSKIPLAGETEAPSTFAQLGYEFELMKEYHPGPMECAVIPKTPRVRSPLFRGSHFQTP